MYSSLRHLLPSALTLMFLLCLSMVDTARAEQALQDPDQDQTQPEQEQAPDATNAVPATELNPIKAKYSASLEKGIPFNGSATRSLKQRDDGLWEYRFYVDSFIADIRESLLLEWNGHQVIPLEYRYELSGWMIPDRAAKLDFDWNKYRVRNDIKDKPWYMDIHRGVLDKLGFQLQLRQDLKAGKRRMIYEIADGGKLKEYEFSVVGDRKLKTKNHGTVDTVLVEKVREPYKKRETHLWFAPEWDYLLVRMVQVESDGTRYEINLDEARLPDKRIE
ncbi:DUF3108 domain-containing protein [Hydrocarboniclastica marina]|uniref:DUF3108 domain-containing protein n=1 Tax=Hydrocarboniclastica marina TaxID=2259620 RepID=A0A4P7XH68_9ALTE|nr:DUF3108 domain-containing protein [Hydrocarboniclastica marina]QCF26356.1 DUF3108 domain-containing protein [Hydrocarboniclastica marina]